MTLQSPSTSASAGAILSPENRAICAGLSKLDSADTRQRAEALLLLDSGSTQAEAAENSDLSIGQIRYLVKRFKEKGMEMFPAELLAEAEAAPAATMETEPAAAEVVIEQSEDKPVPADDTSEPHEDAVEAAADTPATQPKSPARNRKKASKKRPKRPKPIKKKKSKRKRRKKKQGK